MRPIVITRELVTADPNGICLSQTPGAAGFLNLNGVLVSGGVADLGAAGQQRRVLITPAGADAGRTFTIIGTNDAGQRITEALAGANNPATSESVLDYATVTSIEVDAATAGAIEIGTSGVGASMPIPLDLYVPNSRTTITLDVLSGSGDWTVQFTNDDPFGDAAANLQGINVPTPGPFLWFNHPVAGLVNAMADTYGFTDVVMRAVRLLTNSGTGRVRMTVSQQSTQ